MSIDAGDRWVEYQIKERERVGSYMYDHQEDYVSRSRYEKTVEQLTKAKKLIERLSTCFSSYSSNIFEEELLKEAEQFLKEVEK